MKIFLLLEGRQRVWWAALQVLSWLLSYQGTICSIPASLNLRGSIHVLSFYFPTHGKPCWSCCVNTDSSSMQLLGRMSRLKRLDRLGWSRSGNCRCYFASPVDVIWTSVWWGEGEQRQLLSADQSRRLHVPFSAPCPSSLQFRWLLMQFSFPGRWEP